MPTMLSFQLPTAMKNGRALGMHTLNADLNRLVREGMISTESAYKYSNDIIELRQYKQ